MRAALLLLFAVLTLGVTGCMSDASYRHRDKLGFPIPTWVVRDLAMTPASSSLDPALPYQLHDGRVRVAAATATPPTVVYAPAQPPPPPAPPPTIGVVAQ
ncbi:MAG: hypothetical protein KF773_20700 [Deltaproteobacteria bacterium]|nr:hypothetical protein [Deltaproteobacteria bacterium]MCW5806687.1 hypothetical protein [Deltaproteobacteria bacterium]